jgi:glycosyltransferase involved in cell wall biosynthesis
MKIAIAVPDITFKGGAEQVARNIGVALRPVADVIILSAFSSKATSKTEVEETEEGLKVCHLGLQRPRSALDKIAMRLRLSSHVRRALPDVDIIIGNNFYRYWALPPLFGRPICVEVQHLRYEEERPSYLRLLLRDSLYRWLNRVVVLTERDRDMFESHRVTNTRVLPNAVDIPAQDFAAVQRPKAVIAVGRLTEQKNFGALIETWANVSPKMPNWSLIIYGEGEQRDMLERLVDEKGLRASVTIAGHLSDRGEIYTSGSIFCSVSRYEGFHLALFEAASYGLPLVSYDCTSGPREIFNLGDVGRLVPVDDRLGLAQALVELANDRATRDQCGREARRLVEAFSFEKFNARWRQFATSLLTTRRKAS